MHPLSAITLLLAAGCSSVCGRGGPCTVDGGTYYAVVPADWDGATVDVHLHGAGSTPAKYTDDDEVVAAFADAGVLAVFPEGEDAMWRVTGWSGRDDSAFLTAVAADVVARFDADPARLLLSGQSVGAAMVYDVACHSPQAWAAYAPGSGTFWDPIPSDCEPGARAIHHTHGRADTTWPIEDGRDFGSISQGDVSETIDYWRAHSACADSADIESDDVVDCEVWRPCDADTEIRLCLHDGGHAAPEGWVQRQLDWFAAR